MVFNKMIVFLSIIDRLETKESISNCQTDRGGEKGLGGGKGREKATNQRVAI